MNYQLDKDQIEFYRTNGFVVIEDFLSADELEHWREAVIGAVAHRKGQNNFRQGYKNRRGRRHK